ncbi:unnamed protein product [Auanema sp. JU1783]|nr:unnamed protein product [Auanema sp. JU1783]
MVLVRSIRDQRKSSQSTQFLANQRRITISVISFMTADIVGIGLPIICLVACGCFGIGTTVVFQCVMISMCLYPAFGSYFVLMSNTEYRNRINSIFRRGQKDAKSGVCVCGCGRGCLAHTTPKFHLASTANLLLLWKPQVI